MVAAVRVGTVLSLTCAENNNLHDVPPGQAAIVRSNGVIIKKQIGGGK
jgi:hypothetical protein